MQTHKENIARNEKKIEGYDPVGILIGWCWTYLHILCVIFLSLSLFFLLSFSVCEPVVLLLLLVRCYCLLNWNECKCFHANVMQQTFVEKTLDRIRENRACVTPQQQTGASFFSSTISFRTKKNKRAVYQHFNMFQSNFYDFFFVLFFGEPFSVESERV